MKKLLAIALTLLLTLSACALADGAELLLNKLNVSILEGETYSTLDFSGIDLRLALADDDEAGVRIALDAAGETLINGVATIAGEDILLALDGLDNVYSLPLAEVQTAATEISGEISTANLEAIIPALETLGTDLESFFAGVEFVEGEPMDIYGETYDTQVATFSPEQLQELALIFADFADALPDEFQQAILEDGEYASLREALEADPCTLSLVCSVHTLEDKLAVDFVLGDEQEPDSTLYAQFACIPGVDEEMGMEYIQLSGALMEIYGEEMTEILNASLTINLNPETGNVYDLFGGIFFPVEGAVIPTEENMDEVLADESFLADNYDGIHFGVLSPEADVESGLWAAYIVNMDETVYMHFACSDPEEEYGYYEFAMEEGDTYAMVSLQETGESSASVYCGFYEGDSGVDVTFDAAISEVDNSWAAIDGTNAINALEMTEEQTTALDLQLRAVGMNALSGLMRSNEVIGALAGSLLGMAR